VHDVTESVSEQRRLRRTMRDLVALSTLPAVWIGFAPQRIGQSLADVLLEALGLDLILVSFSGENGNPPVEVVRSYRRGLQEDHEVAHAADRLREAARNPSDRATITSPFGTETLHLAVTRFGASDDAGLVIAASRRSDFPSEQDRLLLGVGANQTAVVLQRQKIEAELRRTQADLEDFFENATVGSHWVGADGTILRANRAELDLLGYRREDYVGQPIAHFHVDQAVIGDILQRLRAGERLQEYPAQLRCSDGSIKDVLIDSSVLWRDGKFVHTRCFTRDVTQRNQAEAIARAQEERTRAILESISDAFCALDHDWRFTYVNHHAEVLLARRRDDLLGKNQWEEYPDTVGTELERSYHLAVAQGITVSFEYFYAAHDHWYEFHTYPSAEGLSVYFRDVSERKRAELVLRVSEQRFRQLADAMPHLVWTATPDGNIDYLNRRWTEFTGLPETSGNDAWGQLLHPDDAPGATAEWARAVLNGTPFEMEIRLLNPARRMYRWHLVRTLPVHDDAGNLSRWFGTGTDISEQKRAEESSRYLASASAELSHVVDYQSTLQKIAALAVPYFADWSAVDVSEQDGLKRLAIAHHDPARVALAQELAREYPPDPESPVGPLAVLRHGKPELISEISEEQLVRSAKDARHLDLIRALGLKSYICVPIVVGGRPFGVLTFATANSGRTYVEADLALAVDVAHRAAAAIENTQLYQALRDSDRRKDEFLATLAHELRNPLAPIRNALQILGMPRVDAATLERARAVLGRQVEHMVRLVDDLLDVSRVVSGKIELRAEPVELAAIVARAIETVQPLIEAQRHQLSISVPSESLLVHADVVRLSQVIGNLLTNAARYTPAGGHISVSAERQGDMAVVTVRDDGVGIDPSMLTRVFELFVQATNADMPSHGGLGIGLTLVKNLVELHGGTIEAQSDGRGKGAAFVVRLPALQQVAAGVPRTELEASPVAQSGRRVLIVDDNQDAASTLATLLQMQGHEVRVAFSGRAALDIAKGYAPHVVFLDIGMPDMDGYEVARRLRQESGLENIVVAALTGWAQQADRRRTSAAGFDHHFVKPPDPQILLKLLSEVAS
jgi:PAS domain S-box-containing protein